ncbi:hypothetical protein BD408DRAFT_204768 [Parasitella parasitica]|nr:hypothetical protein BD408DRAFT_204768 [Parasitella parasitica]
MLSSSGGHWLKRPSKIPPSSPISNILICCILRDLCSHSRTLFFRGDTIPGSLLSLGVKMKMDLRLITINNSKLQDHGYGEVAKECSTPKYFKDKRKTVVASKALLNSVINKNAINQEKDCVYIPYLIAMGFEMHLCIVFLKSNSFYITKKVKTITFPSNLNNFAKESIEVANGLLDLVVSIKKKLF